MREAGSNPSGKPGHNGPASGGRGFNEHPVLGRKAGLAHHVMGVLKLNSTTLFRIDDGPAGDGVHRSFAVEVSLDHALCPALNRRVQDGSRESITQILRRSRRLGGIARGRGEIDDAAYGKS